MTQKQYSNTGDYSIWTEKYRPKSLADYYISKKQMDNIKEWITEVQNHEPDAKPFLILYGMAGIGKTTLAHLILQKYGYEIIECNASDTRSKKQLKETLGGISKVSVCIDNKNNFKPTAIIMDEIDGLTGSNETSGVQELIDIVIVKDKQSKDIKWVCPVICTTNSIKEKKLQNLLRYGVLIHFEKPSANDCNKLITKIAKNENFAIPDVDKDRIILTANGDYRQIIMLLHAYYLTLQYKSHAGESINNEGGIPEDVKNVISGIKNYGNNVVECDGYIYDTNVVKQINNFGDSPLDNINYFLTHDIDLDTIRYFCSGDSNLFFMNFYNNVIPIISQIQDKQNQSQKTKESLLQNYKTLIKMYDSVKNADLLNNTIFLDKNWELLDYFDVFSVGIPSKIIYQENKKIQTKMNGENYDRGEKKDLVIKDFNLTHHTQYNYMRQEQALNKKTLAIDYMKTLENDIYNIYYSMKRFYHNNEESIKKFGTKSRKKNIDPEETKFIVNKSYGKIIEKLDELLK